MTKPTNHKIKQLGIMLFAMVFLAQAFIPMSFVSAETHPVFNNDSQDPQTLRLKNRTQGTANWQDPVSANSGDTIAFAVYYHNTVSGTTAENTQIRIDFEDNDNSRFSFKSYLWADNADYISDIGIVNISCSEGLGLTFKNKALWYPNQNATGQEVSVTFVQSNSVLVNIGDIPGGWSSQGYIVFEATIDDPQPRFNFQSNDKETLRLKNRTQGDTQWQSSVSADPGDTIAFDVYYNNGVMCSVAENTKVKITFPTNKRSYVSPITGHILSDNAPTVTDTAAISLSSPEALTFSNKVLWYPNQSVNGTQIYPQKGYGWIEVDIDDIPGCWEHQGHVVFEAVVSSEELPAPEYPKLAVNKLVKNISKNHNSWYNSVSASPSDIISFSILVSSFGEGAAENVIIKDILPSKMSYYGSLKVDGENFSGNIISGINLGDIPAKQSRTITFKAKVASKYDFGYGETTLTNTARAYSGSVTKSNSAKVIVKKTAVAGAATEINTGIADTILHSILPPLLIALLLLFLFKTYFFKLEELLYNKNMEKKEHSAQKKLAGYRKTYAKELSRF